MEQNAEQKTERRGTAGARWYVARTEPGRERFAEKRVKAAGFETFFPEWVERVAQGRFTMLRERPMFPGYLFAQFDAARDPWGEIVDAPGIIGVLCQGRLPVAVSSACIELIQRQIAVSREMRRAPADVKLVVGQMLQILDGLFEGCRVEYLRRKGKNLIVWLDTGGGGMPLEVSQDLVAPVP